jgi:hypothetical protein
MSSYPALPEFARDESERTAVINAPSLLLTDDLPRRPRSIDLAAGAMIAAAVIGLVISGVTFGSLYHFNATYPIAVAPIGANDQFVREVEAVVRAGLIVMAAAALILSIVQAALTSGVVRGNRGARMGAWVLSAVGVAYAMATLLTMVAAHSISTEPSSGATTAAVVQTAQDSIPGWFTGLVGMLAMLQILGFVAAAILLAVPSAGAFYRRIMRPWRPTV